MQGPKTEEERLQMFFDGELPSEEEAAVRQSLESSEELATELEQWGQLRESMQRISSEWAEGVDSEALFARIESELEAPAARPSITTSAMPSAPPPLRVVPGGRERKVWGAMAGGLAAAAAMLLAVFAWPAEPNRTEIARGSEVVQVDVGEYAGTVFMVEGGAGQPLSVVWISDEEVGVP